MACIYVTLRVSHVISASRLPNQDYVTHSVTHPLTYPAAYNILQSDGEIVDKPWTPTTI